MGRLGWGPDEQKVCESCLIPPRADIVGALLCLFRLPRNIGPMVMGLPLS